MHAAIKRIILRLRDTSACAVRNVLGNVYLSSVTINLWYEQREQLNSRSGGALSQGAGLRIRCIAMQKRAVQFTKKPYLQLFLSETADKFILSKKASVMPCTL